jgi:hypothetical protein
MGLLCGSAPGYRGAPGTETGARLSCRSRLNAMSYHLVWFKRDLRLHDHAALHAAS